ncbi:hypothetical protein L6452_15301 [Arctium lappa]|uniref:Uncharacterized protein n=1 Tax=Arctium lappa TaxID=4217 RepID=A0ACB9CN73_ARCLA|nr:hypothetical protein L6452_15301 [Arctium lappa]
MSQIPASDKTGLGFWKEQDEPKEDSSMLMFGMFVSSIPHTSSIECSSSSSSNIIPEELSKSSKLADKGKSISHPQKATKKAKLKQKVDLKPKKSEELKVPPRSYAKGIVGAGPVHLKFSNLTGHGPKATIKYRKYYHCGHTTHIASKCPNATKAEKVTKDEKSTKVKNTTKGSKVIWYLDSECSRHMTGQKDLLNEYKEEKGPSVTFGGNGKGYTRGFGVLSNGTTTFRRVAYVDGLKHNLLSIIQLRDKDYEVRVTKKACSVVNENGKLALSGYRMENVYVIDMDSTTTENVCYLSKASPDVNWLWHKRLSLLNFKTLNSLSSKELVSCLPQHSYAKEYLCSTYEYSRYTWVIFLRCISDTPEELISFVRKMEVLNNLTVRSIRSDHGTEFKNSSLKNFFESKGISHNFSSVGMPQQNGVAERRNKKIIEVARSMLSNSHLPTQFWAEAVKTACFTQNRSLIVKRFGKTTYDLFHGRKPSISFLHIFGCQCFILNNKDSLRKFNPKADDGIFLGETKPFFSNHQHTNHPAVDDDPNIIPPNLESTSLVSAEPLNTLPPSDLPSSENLSENNGLSDTQQLIDDEPQASSLVNIPIVDPTPEVSDHSPAQRWTKDHPIDKIFGDPDADIQTRRSSCNIKQTEKGTFINQDKYVIDMLKKFDLTQTSTMETPMAPPLTLNKDPAENQSMSLPIEE